MNADLFAGLAGRVVVLASSSIRRQLLLGHLGLVFQAVRPDVDERPLPGEAAAALVERLAAAKARAGAALFDALPPDRSVIVAADTVVAVDGDILGKPETDAVATEMLQRLSGRTHLVHTGMAIVTGDELVWRSTVTAEVTFRRLDRALLEWYVGTGEPHDKAGGYGLQGAGAVLVESVSGSPSAVVGLDLAELVVGLRSLPPVASGGAGG